MLDGSIAVLSWRWDIRKEGSLDDMKPKVSQKVVAFIEQARALGFKWAWCDYATVPQFSSDNKLLMVHIHSSRVLYKRCSVLVLDVEPLVPGLAVPTMDFQTRLWIAAEKSAVLSNPHVDIGTYVQLSRMSLTPMLLALRGPWADVHTTLQRYHEFVQSVTARGADERARALAPFSTQAALHEALWAMPGYQLLEARYPGLPAFLNPHSGEPPADTRHEREPPPLSPEEQEALVSSYYVETAASDGPGPGSAGRAALADEAAQPSADAAASSPLEAARRRTPLGRAHPAVRALLEELDGATAGAAAASVPSRPASFSYHEHFGALLLLLSEVLHALTRQRKFDPLVFDYLTLCLGQHPVLPAPEPDAPYALKAFVRSDFAVVKELILADAGEVALPGAIERLALPAVPTAHEVKTQLMADGSVEQLVRERLVINPVRRDVDPAGSPVRVHLMLMHTMGMHFATVQLVGRDAQLTVSPGGDGCMVEVWGNPAEAFCPRELSAPGTGYTLAADEVWLLATLTLVQAADPTKPVNASLMGAARGVTTDSVRALTGALGELLCAADTHEAGADELLVLVRELAADAGIGVDASMFGGAPAPPRAS